MLPAVSSPNRTSEALIRNDGPEDRCFGCGHSNPRGLQLTFRPREDGVETVYQADEALAGAPGVLHGGIQATLLDEVLGMAIHVARDHRDEHYVTAEFQLRYRRPVPTRQRLRVLGRCVRVEGRDAFVEGEILSEAGERLTTAEARWRRIPTREGA